MNPTTILKVIAELKGSLKEKKELIDKMINDKK